MSPNLRDDAAERAVLSACLADAVALAEASEVLSAEDFCQPHRGALFAAMTVLAAQGEPVDPITVTDQLRRSGTAWEASQREIAALGELAPSEAVRRHATIVAELARKRRLATAGRRITESALDPAVPSSDVVAEGENQFEAAIGEMAGSGGPVPVGDVVTSAAERVTDARANGGGLRGLSTGSVDLDAMLGGMESGSLVVVGARPAMGKTAFGTGVALHNAKGGVPTLFVSAEMSAAEVGTRILASEAKASTTMLRTGRVSPNRWPGSNGPESPMPHSRWRSTTGRHHL